MMMTFNSDGSRPNNDDDNKDNDTRFITLFLALVLCIIPANRMMRIIDNDTLFITLFLALVSCTIPAYRMITIAMKIIHYFLPFTLPLLPVSHQPIQ